jgi:hypothetical protein
LFVYYDEDVIIIDGCIVFCEKENIH